MIPRHRVLPTALLTTLGAFLVLPPLAAAQAADAPPAGGAAIDQVIIATAGAIVLFSGLIALAVGHRTGRLRLLDWGAEVGERSSGLPYWAALPAGIVSISLLGALFGMLWDMSLHGGQGRDEGPLANPAHYFILAGLFGVFAGGFIAMVLPRERPSRSAIRITRDWHAPLGGVLIAACGAFALIGFPLDDMWHRLFGQDVTLWGPTHLMLIGGAAMTLIGVAVLLVEADRATAGTPRGRELRWARFVRWTALAGAFLLGMNVFIAEFDFGFGQFNFAFQPMLIMLAAGSALVAARIWLGPGAALAAVAFFLVVRGVIALLVGPVLGETTPHFPLYVVSAIAVEVVGLRIATSRPLAFGLASGALIGTFGLAAEWGWSHVFMPLPWPPELLLEAATLGFGMAIAGALIGAWIGSHLASDRIPRSFPMRWAAVASAAAIVAMVAVTLYRPPLEGISAEVTLEDATPPPERTVNAALQLDPPDAAEGAKWLTAFAWQGGEPIIIDRLEPAGEPGAYRTTEPIPVHGTWKSGFRLHRGRSLVAVPLYMPEDPAIPAEEVPAPPHFERPFISEIEILQREQKDDVPAGLVSISYTVVIAITFAFLMMIAWALHRLALTAEPRRADRGQPPDTGNLRLGEAWEEIRGLPAEILDRDSAPSLRSG